MADFVFNIAKGRAVQLAKNVDDGSPANSRLVAIAFNAGDTDATIRDVDTVAAIEALASTAEVTNTNYARKTIAAADITITVDDTNDWVDVDISDILWNTAAPHPSAGTAWTDICIAYDPDYTTGADADLIPLSWHDAAVTPDGNQITVQIATAGLYRAN